MALAASVRVSTSPNPWVGCVIEPGGFEGATAPPGGPHAEAAALAQAGERARGSTLVVTLEPCAHHGRTPPCADAIIEAGVAKVVVALEDPDPRVRGRGIARLREAGIEVELGVCAEAVRAQLAPYLKHRRTGRPDEERQRSGGNQRVGETHDRAQHGRSRRVTGPGRLPRRPASR